MHQTYQEAERVLALDQRLMETSMHAPSLELLTRLRLCGWMRRLWTFQEGIVAQEVCLQFRDGFRTSTELRDTVSKEFRADPWHRYILHYYETRPLLGSLDGERNHRPRNLSALGPMVKWRATSYRADEAVVLANVLGVDPRPILALGEDDFEGRMIALLQSFEEIPVEFLFSWTDHVSRRGWRWAPASFLNCFRTINLYLGQYDTVGGQTFRPGKAGLTCALPGLILYGDSSDQLRIGEAFVIAPRDRPATAMQESLYLRGARPSNVDGSDRLQRPALILTLSHSSQNELLHSRMGALVDLWEEQEDAGPLRCDFITAIGLVGVEHGAGKSKPVVEARFTAENQQWLVY